MKAMQFIFYFIIFNAVLALFTTISVYSAAASMQSDEEWAEQEDIEISNVFGMLNIIGFEGVGAGLILGITTIGISYLTGASPYVAMAYGLMTGLFAGMWVNMFGWFDKIIVWSEDYDGLEILKWAKLLIGTIFVLLFIWGLVQMSTGGGKGQE